MCLAPFLIHAVRLAVRAACSFGSRWLGAVVVRLIAAGSTGGGMKRASRWGVVLNVLNSVDPFKGVVGRRR